MSFESKIPQNALSSPFSNTREPLIFPLTPNGLLVILRRFRIHSISLSVRSDSHNIVTCSVSPEYLLVPPTFMSGKISERSRHMRALDSSLASCSSLSSGFSGCRFVVIFCDRYDWDELVNNYGQKFLY